MLPGPVLPYIRQSDFAVRAPWRLGARRLLDYLLIFMQEGRCLVTVEETSYELRAGDFCLIQPDQLHILHGLTNTITPFAHLDIFYNPRREESFPTRPIHTDLTAFRDLQQPRLNDIPGVGVPVVFRPADSVRFRETMLKMVGVWQQRDTLSQLEAQHLATELVLALLREFSRRELPPVSKPQSLNWITSFLSFHIAEPLTVADMARRAQLSPSHFATLFRQTFGTSPHQYLMRLRVQQAQELLDGTDYPLHEIAAHCGFADVQHFAKLFKRLVGQPPSAYRARQV